MAPAALTASLSVAEYLATSYRPDCDYLDGKLKERAVGETPHSGLQLYLGRLIMNHRATWGLRAYTEQRVQITPTRYRVPDVCAIRPDGPPGGVLRKPPVLCIEILSHGDSLADMQERIDDYLAAGVPNIWLIDPIRRRAWTADATGLHPLSADAFTIPETPVHIPLADLYRELDDIAAGR